MGFILTQFAVQTQIQQIPQKIERTLGVDLGLLLLTCFAGRFVNTFFLILSECLSNVLITGESNLGKRNGQLIRGSFLKK